MNKALFPLAVAFIVVGLVGGFMIVGGPEYARMERHDQQRAQDLRMLGQYYRCQPEVYHPRVTAPNRCERQRTKPTALDPVTGAEYQFALVDADTFEVCAEFQTDAEQRRIERARRPNGFSFEGQRGCMRYNRTSAGEDFVPMTQFQVSPKS